MGSREKACNSRRIEGVKEEVALMNTPNSSILEIGLPCKEFLSLMKNETWALCDSPEGRKVMKIRRVFKIKIDLNGNIDLHILYGKSCASYQA
jgi:hypothetical protein